MSKFIHAGSLLTSMYKLTEMHAANAATARMFTFELTARLIYMKTYAANAATARKCAFELTARLIIL